MHTHQSLIFIGNLQSPTGLNIYAFRLWEEIGETGGRLCRLAENMQDPWSGSGFNPGSSHCLSRTHLKGATFLHKLLILMN